MFERERWRWAAWRPVDPPRRVWVVLAVLYPPQRLGFGRDTAMWARAQGMQVRDTVPAWLSGWAMTSVGDWLGRCAYKVTVGGHTIAVDHLVPAAAILPHEPDTPTGR